MTLRIRTGYRALLFWVLNVFQNRCWPKFSTNNTCPLEGAGAFFAFFTSHECRWHNFICIQICIFSAKILYTSPSACYTKSLLPWNGYPEKSGVMVMIIWRTNSPLLIELSSSSFNLEQPFLFDHRSATDTDQRPNSSPSFFLLLFLLLLRRRRLNCPLPLNPPPAPRRSP